MKGDVTLVFDTAKGAEVAAAALAPDDDGFLEARVDGATLTLHAEADSMMGLLRTLDDALGCLRAAGFE